MPEGFLDGTVQVEYLMAHASINAPWMWTIGVVADEIHTAQDIADDANAAWQSNWATNTFDNDATYLGTRVRGVLGGVLVAADHPVSSAGTSSATRPLPSAAIVVRKNTGHAGRKHQGRFFLPSAFFTAAAVSEVGVMDPTELASIQTRLSAWYTDLQAKASVITTAVLHKDESIADPITSLTAEAPLGTQRRRLHRFGR